MPKFVQGSRSAWRGGRTAAALSAALVPLLAAAPAVPLPDGDVFRRSDHVVVVSVDGLRPDAIEAAGAETMLRLMREGSYSLTAQTILPSKTLPSHTSMVTGVEPAVHGVTWNDDRTLIRGTVRVPTMFGLSRAAGLTTAAFFSKSKFHHLEVPGTLDHVESPFGWWGRWRAERVVHEVEQHLERHRPNLTFVHLAEPDYAGHASGWMSPAYLDAVREADRAVARVLQAADQAFGEGDYTLILTADHGGQGHGHGSPHPLERTIPWISWGRGVTQGAGAVLGPIQTTDTAATVLWLLGVPVPEEWVGRPVMSAFGEDAARVPATP